MGSESTTFGSYELIRRVARGGMAEVFLAVERGLEGIERQVAIKRILPHMAEADDFITMFMDEARVAARLTHPNIAHLYSFGEVEGTYYLAMEFVEGLTVSKLIKLSRPESIGVAVALRLVADVCSALHYAHEMRDKAGASLGLVHRDVNPQNVMVSRNGGTKLLDFGVARAASQSHATRVGQVKGKLGYIAPEVFRGKTLDRRADLFSTGALLYEMLAGRKLFKREIEAATIHAILNDHPASLAGELGLPAVVDSIIGRAVAKDPEERYQTALAMQQDIEQLIVRRGYVATPFVIGQLVVGLMDQSLGQGESVEASSGQPSSWVAPSEVPLTIGEEVGDVPTSSSQPSVSSEVSYPSEASYSSEPSSVSEPSATSLPSTPEDALSPAKTLEIPAPPMATSPATAMGGGAMAVHAGGALSEETVLDLRMPEARVGSEAAEQALLPLPPPMIPGDFTTEATPTESTPGEALRRRVQDELEASEGVESQSSEPAPMALADQEPEAIAPAFIEAPGTVPSLDVVEDPHSEVYDFGYMRRRRRTTLIVVGVVAVLFAFGLVIGLVLSTGGDSEGTPPGEEPALSGVGSPPAKLPTLQPEAGVASINDTGPGTKVDAEAVALAPTKAGDAEPPGEPPRPDRGKRPVKHAPPPPAPPGKLYLHTSPWTKVRLGSRSLGSTPLVGVSVPAGSHSLIMVDSEGNRHLRRIKVRSGQPTKLSLDLRR